MKLILHKVATSAALLGVLIVLTGTVQAFDFLDWLNDWHVQMDWGSAPVRVSKPAQPMYIKFCSDCTAYAVHETAVDRTVPTYAQVHWQVPLYLKDSLTVGVDGNFTTHYEHPRNTIGGYAKYSLGRFSMVGQLGMSSYLYRAYTKGDHEGLVTGRSNSTPTLAVGFRYNLTNSITVQATFQRVEATRIDAVSHGYEGYEIPGVTGPPVDYGASSSILFSVGIHPPIPSWASIKKAVEEYGESVLEEALSQLQGTHRELAEGVIREMVAMHSYQVITQAPKGGTYYDSENNALVLHLKYYDPMAEYHQGLRRDEDFVTWFGEADSVNEIWAPLREKFIGDIIKSIGKHGGEIEGAPAKVILNVDFASFSIDPDRKELVDSPRWPYFEFVTVKGGVGNIWNYTASLELVLDSQQPIGVKEISAGTRLVDGM